MVSDTRDYRKILSEAKFTMDCSTWGGREAGGGGGGGGGGEEEEEEVEEEMLQLIQHF